MKHCRRNIILAVFLIGILTSAFASSAWTLFIQEPIGSGSTEPLPGTYTYNITESAVVMATPNENWELRYWLLNGENAGTANPVTITCQEDAQTRTLQAVFRQKHRVSVHSTPVDGVKITGEPATAGGITNYELLPGYGSSVIFSAPESFSTWEDSYIFEHWDGGTPVGSSRAGSLNWCDLKITPSRPGENEPVTLELSGIWNHSGAPDKLEVKIHENTIIMVVSCPDYGIVLPVLTPWRLKETLHSLEPGEYRIEAVLNCDQYAGTDDISPEFIGWLLIPNAVSSSIRLDVWHDTTVTANYSRGRIPLREAIDQPAWIIKTGGDADWFGQTDITFDKVDAAQSGAINNRQESWMETRIQGWGILSFYWKISSELNSGWLEFYINEELQDRISGNADWERKIYKLGGRSQTVRWRYVRDGSTHDGMYAGWVDQVVWNRAPFYDSRIISANLPPTLLMDKHYEFELIMENTGSETWRSADLVRLGAVGDHDILTQPEYWRVGLFLDVEPGETHAFTIPLQVPLEKGMYVTEWRMLKEGEFWFGDTFTYEVEVDEVTAVNDSVWQLFK